MKKAKHNLRVVFTGCFVKWNQFFTKVHFTRAQVFMMILGMSKWPKFFMFLGCISDFNRLLDFRVDDCIRGGSGGFAQIA